MVAVVLAVHAARWAIASLILLMGMAKTTSPTWLAEMGIQWLPSPIALFLGTWLPWLEVSLALLVISPAVWRPASKLTAVLLLLFIPVLLVFLLEGRSDCGCAKGVDIFPEWFSHPWFALPRNILMATVLWTCSRLPGLRVRIPL
jgi:hypothetical protein